jgi:hypothetical protein
MKFIQGDPTHNQWTDEQREYYMVLCNRRTGSHARDTCRKLTKAPATTTSPVVDRLLVANLYAVYVLKCITLSGIVYFYVAVRTIVDFK